MSFLSNVAAALGFNNSPYENLRDLHSLTTKYKAFLPSTAREFVNLTEYVWSQASGDEECVTMLREGFSEGSWVNPGSMFFGAPHPWCEAATKLIKSLPL